MVHFAEYIYRNKSVGVEGPILGLTGRRNGKWEYINVLGRRMDKEKFERFKTRFYRLQGWDPATGYPVRSTLEALDLAHVANELEEHGKLGKEPENS
jgi:aldehyde:ferredoxin oxidoreductase